MGYFSNLLLLALLLVSGSFFPVYKAEAPQGFALLIATHTINPAAIKQKRFGKERPTPQYGSTEFVESDITLMKAILSHGAFDVKQVNELVGARITAAAVRQALADLAGKAKPGDLVFIYFTGHGEQTTDTNGDEDDGLDESMVLYDDLLVDDEVAVALNQFAAGVRCVLLVDACHSGSTNKMLSAQTKSLMIRSSKSFFEGDARGRAVQGESGACTFRRVNPENTKSVIYLGASADDQKAKGTPMGSYFTTALWTFYKDGDGSWRGYNYRTAFCELKSRVNSLSSGQTVHYEEDGKTNFAINDYILKINQ